jgi:hypothetical protein
MCLIVDANVAVQFFCKTDLQSADLQNAVFGKGCCVVYGGHLRVEYERLAKARRIVLALDRAGKARAIPDGPVEELTQTLRDSGGLDSDDPHIIALAQVSGSRLLHSLDTALHQDFTNPVLINHPRGRVYQGGASHRHLVRAHCKGC